jgi:hypothetical protein
MTNSACPGCGAVLDDQDGPVHAYMASSPACWAAFGALLAAEYADPRLMGVHRLSVDTYAVQHPGAADDRRAVQSVGLHLARLMQQLDQPRAPDETNAIMVRFTARKHHLVRLAPPVAFTLTVANVTPAIGGPRHSEQVLAWARATWADYRAHHDYIRAFAAG